MNKDTKDIIELVLLGIIAATLLFGSFGNGGDNIAPAQQQANNPAAPANNSPTVNPTQPGLPPQLQNQQQPQQPAQNLTVATYDNEVVDIGTVAAGATKEHTFNVTNTGTNPLTFSGISADQGMEIVSQPATAIPPNGTGEIKVKVTAEGAPGAAISKVVHVNSNATNSHMHLTVNAKVQ